MRTLEVRLQEAARRSSTPRHIIERDYALSYVLAGFASHPELADTLVFKGGTALKKVYFGDYRFSEDLDFSGRKAPSSEELETAVSAATGEAARLLLAYGPFSVQVEQLLLTLPHPQGQEAFIVRVHFPWHRRPLCAIKVEITHEEPVLLEPAKRWLIHGYEEDLKAQISCYRLEEIVAEKLRTLLQTQRMILQRGWSRPRARDYYDLWRILQDRADSWDADVVRAIMEVKCAHRQVGFRELGDFFTPELTEAASRDWDAGLRTVVVGELPPWADVLARLKALVAELLQLR